MSPRLARCVTAVVAVAALGLLAGCAPAADPTWQPAGWAASAVTLATAPDVRDAAAVANLNGQRIRNDDVGVQARWMRLPGDNDFNARATQIVRDAVGARASASGTAYTPAVFASGAGLGDRTCVTGSTGRPAADVLADASLGPAGGSGTAVVCDVVLAAGAFFGERIRVVSGSPDAVTADTSIVLYADTATGEAATAAQLWTDAAATELWDDIVDALRRAHGSLSLAAVQPPSADALAALTSAMAQTLVAADGSLVVTLPAGFTAPELTALGVSATSESMTVSVDAAVAATLTTPFGQALIGAASQPYEAPAQVSAGFETVDCTLVPCVALTYDDGPSDWTPGILDAVAAHHASVTFFAMGEKASSYASVISRAVAEGNPVENHTWDHPHLRTLTPEQATAQIRDTTAAITAASGGTAPTVFRPPYGEYDAAVLTEAGMPAILWDVDSFDWQGPADDVLIERVVDQPRPGSIVLQHDIQPNTGRTVDAVYTGLADRGFTLVNITQLFGGTLPTHGAWSSGR